MEPLALLGRETSQTRAEKGLLGRHGASFDDQFFHATSEWLQAMDV